jgi:hypothetical protein
MGNAGHSVRSKPALKFIRKATLVKWFTDLFYTLGSGYGRGDLHLPARPRRRAAGKRLAQTKNVKLHFDRLEDRLAPATLVQTLYPPAPGTAFGLATATDSIFNVVGALGPRNQQGGYDHGVAYVYSAATGALVASLPDPSPAGDDAYGASVSVSGNTVVVGAWRDTGAPDGGKAYVFNATTGELIATLANPSGAHDAGFGYSVSVSGNTVAVGAFAWGGSTGQAYVFDATTGGLIAVLDNPSPPRGLFGLSVSVSGDMVAVGAPGDDTGAPDSGQAYVFDATSGGLIATLANPSPSSNAHFGTVSVSGNTVVVAAPDDNRPRPQSGKAYVFNATTGELIANLANPSAANEFGASLSVSGNTVVVGADGAYVFNATTGALIATLANPSPIAHNAFGGSVSVSGTTAIVGAPHDAGAAYVYSLDSNPATQLAINNLSSTSVTVGNTVTFTVTAQDSTGAVVPSYTGSVQLTSTDGHAVCDGKSLPTSYTFVAGDHGTHTFTATLQTAGSQTITATDQANNSLIATTNPITVSAGPFSKFLVSIPGGNTLVAGNPFLVSVQAADQFGNPVTSYSGPTSVAAAASPPDPQAESSIIGTLNSSGFGLFLGNLKTVGNYTLTATAGNFSGTSGNLAVIPSDPTYFTVTAPAAATTGNPVRVTVTAYDHFGNIATSYTGTAKLTGTDSAANLGSYTFTTGAGKDNGIHTFPVTFKTAGSQTITATDTASTNPTITGTSNPFITCGLVVTGLTPTATGFTVNFSEPFTVDDVNLYGGSQASPLQDVTLVGKSSGPVNGSFVVDPSGTSATFKASSIFLSTFFQSSVLPDDTWTVTLVSGTGAGATAHGFFDALNVPLDGGNNAGHDNYTTTFTTSNSSKEVLSIPDFARGPDGANTVKVPNDSAKGIPVTLANVPAASGATDVVFTLTYNPTLLTPTGAGTGDSSGTSSTFAMGTPVSVDATHSTVTFTWHNAASQSGTVVLGDILANVPNSAANAYKGKEILDLSQIKVNGSDFTGVWVNGLHVNAYFGDVTGDGKISALDVATAAAVASGSSEGLSAYKLIDPAVVGDIAGDASSDATAVSDLASVTSNLPISQMPAIPTGMTIIPGGPDPTLSLAQERMKDEGGRMNQTNDPIHPSSFNLQPSISVMLDDPHPAGSTGMEEAVLALTYDPKVLTVSSSDITLGSIPCSGTGWHLVSVVDRATGQIGIDLYSTTPISSTQAGSLVNIAFHVVPGLVPATVVRLANAVTPNGRYFGTEVADDQGKYVLSPGKDRLVVETGLRSVASPIGFEIGTLPMLNAFLMQNSPRQLATDTLFSGLAMRADAANDAAQEDNFWATSLSDEHGNAASLSADKPMVVSRARQPSREPALDRVAIQAVFDQMDW